MRDDCVPEIRGTANSLRPFDRTKQKEIYSYEKALFHTIAIDIENSKLSLFLHKVKIGNFLPRFEIKIFLKY